MPLPIGEELLVDMSVMVLNYKKICKHLQLSDEQMRSINAGDWVVDLIKQVQTSALITKAKMLNNHPSTSIEGYSTPITMPPLPSVEPGTPPEKNPKE